MIGFLADFALSLFFLSFLVPPMHRPVGRTDGEYEQQEEQESPTHVLSLLPTSSSFFLFLSSVIQRDLTIFQWLLLSTRVDSTRGPVCFTVRPSVRPSRVVVNGLALFFFFFSPLPLP